MNSFEKSNLPNIDFNFFGYGWLASSFWHLAWLCSQHQAHFEHSKVAVNLVHRVLDVGPLDVLGIWHWDLFAVVCHFH